MPKFKTPGIVAVAYKEPDGRFELGTVAFGDEHHAASIPSLLAAAHLVNEDDKAGRLPPGGTQADVEAWLAAKVAMTLVRAVKEDRWDDARPLAYALAKLSDGRFLLVEDYAVGEHAGTCRVGTLDVKTPKAFMKKIQAIFPVQEVLKRFG